jgi:hypothetical protein
VRVRGYVGCTRTMRGVRRTTAGVVAGRTTGRGGASAEPVARTVRESPLPRLCSAPRSLAQPASGDSRTVRRRRAAQPSCGGSAGRSPATLGSSPDLRPCATSPRVQAAERLRRPAASLRDSGCAVLGESPLRGLSENRLRRGVLRESPLRQREKPPGRLAEGLVAPAGATRRGGSRRGRCRPP